MLGTSTRNLKVLYVDTEKEWRGGQEQIFGLMQGLRERGHSVELAAPVNSPLSFRSSQAGIRTIDFHQRHELSIRALLLTWRMMRRRNIDIIHLNTPRTLVSVGLAAGIERIPVVCSRRVDFPLRSRLSAFKYNWLVDAVFTISASIRRTLISGGVQSALIRVIYEGLDPEWLAEQELNGPAPVGSETVVGTVAALTGEKGHSYLLDAAKTITRSNPSVRFVLVGEGEERTMLEQKAQDLGISDSVLFTGFRTDSEALTRQFDIFCLPTLSEGLSSAIMVAMAQSVPIVATAVGGIPELVVDGETGLLVPPANAAALAAALQTLLKNPSLRRQMGRNGRLRVHEHFTAEQKLDATEKAYFALLTTKGIR